MSGSTGPRDLSFAPRQSRRAVLENARDAGFRPGTIIDVGFFVGTEGLYGIFEDTHHLLIEPVAEVEPAMKAFCETHPNSSYVVAAASDEPGSKPMVVRRSVGGSSFHGTLKVEDAETREVPTITLDQLVRERQPPKPYLLKLDVEGHELHVLRGAREACLKDAEMVILEVNTWREDRKRGGASLMDLFGFMDQQGFIFYDFIEPCYRPLDGALAVFDGVWVKTDSVLRQVRSFRNKQQYEATRHYKEQKAQQFFGEPKD